MTLHCDVYGTMKPLTYLEIDYDDHDDNRDYSNDESDDDNGDSRL